MFSQQQQIDRLATTSRLLYDVRLISQRQEIEHLKQENEKLKLDIFWRDHSLHRFIKAMVKADIKYTNCRCAPCWRRRNNVFDFHHDEYPAIETACTFLPWLYKKMDEHGFLVFKGFACMNYFRPPRAGPLDLYLHTFGDPFHFISTTLPDMRGRLPETYRFDAVVDKLESNVIDELRACPQRDYGLFRFGSLLCDAKTADDPSLKKYAAFLRMLEGVQEEDEDDDDEDEDDDDA